MDSAIHHKMQYPTHFNPIIIYKRILVAKQNYAFEKRQKEIAKKKKKEEKRKLKAGVDDSQSQDVQATPENDDTTATSSDT